MRQAHDAWTCTPRPLQVCTSLVTTSSSPRRACSCLAAFERLGIRTDGGSLPPVTPKLSRAQVRATRLARSR